MVLTLYGTAMATARVLMVIHEKKIPYHFIPIDLASNEHKQEAYLRRQPFGKVPAIEDDGFCLFESRAICRYLDRKYDSAVRLMPDPDDAQAYARFDEACSVEQSYFGAAAEGIGIEMFFRPSQGLGDPDMARVAAHEANLDTVLAYYEGILSGQQYLTGQEMTLVDIFHVPYVLALMAGPWRSMFEKYPNVVKWFQVLRSRESWKQAAEEADLLKYVVR